MKFQRSAKVTLLIVLISLALSGAAQSQKSPAPSTAKSAFTIEQALSAPFPTDLVAAPARNRVAWVFNAQGRRNIWVAGPVDGGFKSRQITSYTEDDGQDLGELSWSPDAETIVYTRGGDLEFTSKSEPNPQNSAQAMEQAIWALPYAGGTPRKLAEGHSPAVSPKGDIVAYILKNQIWIAKLDGSTKPEQLIHAGGDESDLRWSPTGAKLAFTSRRTDHGFIGIYDVAAKSVTYLDPSVDRDIEPVWSPDGARSHSSASQSQKEISLSVPSAKVRPGQSTSPMPPPEKLTKFGEPNQAVAASSTKSSPIANYSGCPVISSSFPGNATAGPTSIPSQ